MKINRYFKYYALSWLVGFILFNILTFVVPHKIGTFDRLSQPAFWVGYVLMLVTLLAQLVCSYLFLRDDDKEKIFLRLAVLRVGYVALGVSAVIGTVFMLVPVFPDWLCAVVSAVALCGYVWYGLRAGAAVEAVSDVGERAAAKTGFIHTMSAEAKSLIAYANTPALKDAAERVYEAIRFSVPASTEEAGDIEGDIFDAFTAFSEEVKADNAVPALTASRRLLALIEERNTKCKIHH